jgi:Holliday junction resolvase RusA-like endonuclease
MQGPVQLALEVYLQIPASASKKQQALMASGHMLPTKKPDIDNILKAVKDAVNGVVWRDDSQVTDVRLLKRYSTQPRVQVLASEIEA